MRDIPGYEGKYAVTKDGQVWSYKHNKFLAPKVVKGYLNVDIFGSDKKKRQIGVHRCVALTYLPNPDNLPCVNHKDENRQNNNVDNLEWCTYRYNNVYGTRIQKCEEKGVYKRWHEKGIEARKRSVRCVELDCVFESTSEAARRLGMKTHAHISSVCQGKRKRAGGYHWEYVEKQ